MNDDPVAAFLNRAGVMLRELAEPGWDRIADGVIDAVRGTPRGGTPLRATHPSDSSDDGALTVTDLVLRGILARAVRLDELCVPSLIDVAVEGTELKRIRIELTTRYGGGLSEVAEQVRTAAAAVVEDLLGHTSAGDLVDVVITDVVDGNPVADG
jgi:hypothetical protein